MSKSRLTDAEKFKKPFYRSLNASYKLLWDFLTCNCDHAGFWIVDFDVAQVYLGSDVVVTKADALKIFNADKQRVVDMGDRWFILPFCSIQYPQGLKEANRVHASVIKLLQKYKVYDLVLESYGSDPNVSTPIPEDKKMKQQRERKKKKQEKEESKINYRENVRLTADEYEKLVSGHGESRTKAMIEKLGRYKASSGRKYESDYDAILSWVVERVPASPQTSQSVNNLLNLGRSKLGN